MARRPRPGAHDALLEAAREAFGRVGVARARVEDIARRAGISKGAFYLHFRTKDEALREIVHRFLGALEDHARRRHEVEERVEREHASDPAGQGALFEVECAMDADLLELLWRHRHLLAALDGAGPPYREILADFRRRMRALVASRILERQRSGALRPDVAPEVCGDLVIGAYEDFSRRMAEMREKPDLAAWSRSLLLVVYEGLLARPAPALARRTHSR